MKLSDYVFSYLEKYVDSIFLLSGGGIMHLVDSLGQSKLQAYCCHHEQACATAAEGYARIKNGIGVCCVTTGPGGTNAITGVAGAWLDSIPMLVIGGQVKTDNITPRRNGTPIQRSIGFQELNIIDMIRPITKYSVLVDDPNTIKYHLDRAIYSALSGRPGPSWIEIPLDIQAALIEPTTLKSFTPTPESDFKKQYIPINQVCAVLSNAKRPLVLAGNGIRLAGGEKVLMKVLHKFKLNAATVLFTADDLITYEYPYYLGRQGVSGNYSANYAIDNCDVLLVIGDRLQLTQLSYDYIKFAPHAYKIMVDIDEAELIKKTIHIDLPIHCDAKYFLETVYKQKMMIHRWDIKRQPIDASKFQTKKKYLNVYSFLDKLNSLKNKYAFDIATSDGMASVATHQGLEILQGQRMITNAGLGQMGSGLPLAIGACIANKKKPILCMEGDGSLMLNIQELQTAKHHKLPLKIFIFNNDGYYSIRSTHERYFKRTFASDASGGVTLPNYEKLIQAWGIPYLKIANNDELTQLTRMMEYNKGPIVCELMIDPHQKMLDKWSAGDYFQAQKQ